MKNLHLFIPEFWGFEKTLRNLAANWPFVPIIGCHSPDMVNLRMSEKFSSGVKKPKQTFFHITFCNSPIPETSQIATKLVSCLVFKKKFRKE